MLKLRKLAALGAASLLALTACSSDNDPSDSNSGGIETITVGATPVPHAQVLEFINDELAEDAGIKIEIQEYDDYLLPNRVLDEGDLDANYFQHIPFLEQQIEDQDYKLEHGETIHIEPYAVFSSELESIDDVEDGAVVGITNDAGNQPRALMMLEDAGLLKDIDEDSAAATLTDEQNPKNLVFEENPGEFLVQVLDDPKIDIAIINGNYFVEAGMSADEAIFVEESEDNPYGNVLAWREGEDSEGIKKLEELLHSDEVKDYIESEWPDGDIFPAF